MTRSPQFYEENFPRNLRSACFKQPDFRLKIFKPIRMLLTNVSHSFTREIFLNRIEPCIQMLDRSPWLLMSPTLSLTFHLIINIWGTLWPANSQYEISHLEGGVRVSR